MGRRTPPGPLPVTLREVSFRYPGADQDVLDRIAVAIPPGQVVVLVGPNGAGKSTLAALILGLYPPTRGSVHVGTGAVGHAVRGAVFQDFARYSLPLRDNVGFGDLSLLHNDDHLRAVLRQTGFALHGDLDPWLGAEFGGRELPEGEWTRVAIARGLVRRRGLVVLDEPIAAIDPVTEVELCPRMLEMGAGSTAIVVSHRLGVAPYSDRVLVPDQGRIVEDGSHDELLAQGGLYARLWNAQASWYTDRPVQAGSP